MWNFYFLHIILNYVKIKSFFKSFFDNRLGIKLEEYLSYYLITYNLSINETMHHYQEYIYLFRSLLRALGVNELRAYFWKRTLTAIFWRCYLPATILVVRRRGRNEQKMETTDIRYSWVYQLYSSPILRYLLVFRVLRHFIDKNHSKDKWHRCLLNLRTLFAGMGKLNIF